MDWISIDWKVTLLKKHILLEKLIWSLDRINIYIRPHRSSPISKNTYGSKTILCSFNSCTFSFPSDSSPLPSSISFCTYSVGKINSSANSQTYKERSNPSDCFLFPLCIILMYFFLSESITSWWNCNWSFFIDVNFWMEWGTYSSWVWHWE